MCASASQWYAFHVKTERPAWKTYLLRYLDTALKTLVALVTIAAGITAMVAAATSSPGKWVLEAAFQIDLITTPEFQVEVESPFSAELEAALLEWLSTENAAREGQP